MMVNIARIGRLQGAAMDLTQWLETLPENPSLALAVVAGLSVPPLCCRAMAWPVGWCA